MLNSNNYWANRQFQTQQFVNDSINEINRLTNLVVCQQKVIEDLKKRLKELQDKFGNYDSFHEG